MKLRIKGNSIRLRVTEPEVRTLSGAGVLEECVQFPDGRVWKYRLERVPGVSAAAEFQEALLCVKVPGDQVVAWAKSESVAIEARIPLPGGGVLAILVEKDFECLHPRKGENQPGAYPHPAAATSGAAKGTAR